MEFEEMFENKSKNQGYYRKHRDNYENRYPQTGVRYPDNSYHSYHSGKDQIQWVTILEKIRRSKKLKVVVILAGIVIVTTAVLLVIVFMPFIIKLFTYISQTGLQGILDGVTGFLDKIWKGSGK